MRNSKVDAAAKKYLERKDYLVLEELEEASPFSLVAKDNDETVAFVKVESRSGDEKGLPAETDFDKLRAEFEQEAISWLADSGKEYSDMAIRCDVISITIFDESRAFLRHHLNALSPA